MQKNSLYDKLKIMKKAIHPKYDDKVKASCACGAIFDVGSTMDKIENEICSMCHPFYTGNDKVLDTTGRIDRFKKRSVASAAKAKK